jgi:hypothetical protein
MTHFPSHRIWFRLLLVAIVLARFLSCGQNEMQNPNSNLNIYRFIILQLRRLNNRTCRGTN